MQRLFETNFSLNLTDRTLYNIHTLLLHTARKVLLRYQRTLVGGPRTLTNLANSCYGAHHGHLPYQTALWRFLYISVLNMCTLANTIQQFLKT